MPPSADTIEKALNNFMRKTTPQDGCLVWIGALNRRGYGQFRCKFLKKENHILAHRASWMLFRGPIGGDLVLHKCDNPKCVNPDHLFLGNYKDNTADMILKGRHRRNDTGYLPTGNEHHYGKIGPKIDLEKAQMIKEATGTQTEIGLKFGISAGMVSRIKAGQCWTR